jgi:hypothetical protein
MTSVVRGMDKAMESMNLERISLVMDKFEAQFADLDVQTSYMEDTMQSTTAVSTPQDQIDDLMKQAAEEVRASIALVHLHSLIIKCSPPNLVNRLTLKYNTILGNIVPNYPSLVLEKPRSEKRAEIWQKG